MSTEWISQELETVDLNDKRLDRRLGEVLLALSQQSNVSIPTACGGYAETMAAYRFFSNEKTTIENILAPHRDATLKRIAEQDIVLCVQDDTELDLTRPNQQINGLGPIGSSNSSKRGAYLHLLQAYVPDGTPLGAVWHKLIIRKDETPEEQALKKKMRPKLPITEKESYRWLQGYRQTIQLAEQHPNTTFVCVGDSEMDIFEVIAEPRVPNAHFLLRAWHDREVTSVTEEEEVLRTSLRTAVYATPVLVSKTLQIRSRPAAVPHAKSPRDRARKAREAVLEIRKATVEIQPPGHSSLTDSVKVNVVLISEVSPPEGETPIEWILLTTLPIETLADVL